MNAVFTETVIVFNLYVQLIGISLQENHLYHSKEPKILVWKKYIIYHLGALCLYMISAFE